MPTSVFVPIFGQAKLFKNKLWEICLSKAYPMIYLSDPCIRQFLVNGLQQSAHHIGLEVKTEGFQNIHKMFLCVLNRKASEDSLQR